MATNTPNLTERTYIRLSPEEKKKLSDDATKIGVGESTYLRMVLLGHTKEQETGED